MASESAKSMVDRLAIKQLEKGIIPTDDVLLESMLGVIEGNFITQRADQMTLSFLVAVAASLRARQIRGRMQ